MDPEEKKLLQKTFSLAEKNNTMLKKLVRAMKWRRWTTIFYWGIILALALGAYWLIQPFIQSVDSTIAEIKGEETEGNRPGIFERIIQSFSGVSEER